MGKLNPGVLPQGLMLVALVELDRQQPAPPVGHRQRVWPAARKALKGYDTWRRRYGW